MPPRCFRAVSRSRIALFRTNLSPYARLYFTTADLSTAFPVRKLSSSSCGSRPKERLTSSHGRQYPHGQIRGKRTRTTVDLDDLPQGRVQAAEPSPPEEELPAYPTVVLQARRNMSKFDNCVLLTRVGGFYELYFEQAEEYGPLLNLKVAQKKTNAGPVPMVILSSVFLGTIKHLCFVNIQSDRSY